MLYQNVMVSDLENEKWWFDKYELIIIYNGLISHFPDVFNSTHSVLFLTLSLMEIPHTHENLL